MSDISNLLLYTFFKNDFTARLLRVSRTNRCYILADIFDSCEQLKGLYLNLESKFTWKKRETFEVVKANTIKIINVKPVPVEVNPETHSPPELQEFDGDDGIIQD